VIKEMREKKKKKVDKLEKETFGQAIHITNNVFNVA
tara:strand:- start:100 stop:207 length:108 start_codon:yes stop_codon:yes gene_type:complete